MISEPMIPTAMLELEHAASAEREAQGIVLCLVLVRCVLTILLSTCCCCADWNVCQLPAAVVCCCLLLCADWIHVAAASKMRYLSVPKLQLI